MTSRDWPYGYLTSLGSSITVIRALPDGRALPVCRCWRIQFCDEQLEETMALTWDEELALIKPYVAGRNLRIVEAGCGREWPPELHNESAVLIGIDEDAVAISARKDLHQVVIGDLCTAIFPAGDADIVYSSYVLEHVSGAERALKNFVKWVKPGGYIILRIPDDRSVYGFLAKVLPHWTHVLYKRYFGGYPNAGKPGFGPYPTIYDPAATRPGLQIFARENGCTVVEDHDVCTYLDHGPRVLKLAIAKTVALLSFGRLSWRHDNACVILRKN